MKKIFLMAIVALLSTSVAVAMDDIAKENNVYGHVIDSKTQQHIPYINVTIQGTTIGTVTNENGHYLLHEVSNRR